MRAPNLELRRLDPEDFERRFGLLPTDEKKSPRQAGVFRSIQRSQVF
jgi:hypothetical protein